MFLEYTTRCLYIPRSSSAGDQAEMVRDFVAGGYDARNVFVCSSVWEVVGRLSQGMVLVVYSVGLVGTTGELLGLLTRLQERNILLSSLCEPWINESIRDYIYCLDRLRRTTDQLCGAKRVKSARGHKAVR